MILSLISEEELFKIYCSNFVEVDTAFCSELRSDRTPSCRITDLGSGLRYKDFGTDIPATDIWGYLQIKHNLSHIQVLEKVSNDLHVGKVSLYQDFLDKDNSKPSLPRDKTIIKIRTRQWFAYDKEYWYGNYNIPKKLLESYNIVPIDYYWVEKSFKEYQFLADKLSYCYNYYWHNGLFLRKIYQPLSVDAKWISNIDDTVVQGIANIPKTADLLIISSSLKDVLCWNLLGYSAVAPNNEKTWLPLVVWSKFGSRYKKIIIMFDNDSTGLNSMSKFSEQFNIPYTYIPQSADTSIKNISDFIKNFGINSTKDLVNQLLINQKQ